MSIDNIIELMKKLYPLHRTLNHKDNIEALNIIQNGISVPGFKIHSYAAETDIWTWKVPKRFHVNHATLKDMDGNTIIDYKNNPLSIVSYSSSCKKTLHYDELKEHLFFDENNPTELPWIYKYYTQDWGLTLTKNTFDQLEKNTLYQVDIDTEFLNEPMILGEYFIKGKSDDEVLIITDICHPYQVNDSITGVVIAIELINQIMNQKYTPQQSIRFLFVPETIGSICWLAHNEEKINNMISGLTFDCLGTTGNLKVQKTLYGNSYIDFIINSILKDIEIANYIEYMSNDELVMSSPNIEIPTISFTRAPFKEYHTSGDNMSIINKESLKESFISIQKLLDILIMDYIPLQIVKGPIFMTRYNLWINEEENYDLLLKQHMILQYINGKHSVFEISLLVNIEFNDLLLFLEKLFDNELIEKRSISSCFQKHISK